MPSEKLRAAQCSQDVHVVSYVSTLRGYYNSSHREVRQETVRVPSLSTERLSLRADTSAQCSTALKTVGYYMLATLEPSGRRHGTRADQAAVFRVAQCSTALQKNYEVMPSEK